MNEYTLRQWYDVFKDNKELVEIRILDPNNKKSYSGYFTDIETLLKEIKPFDYCNIYFTLNIINPACYDREQHDRISMRPKATTSDADIIAREWCLIDVDIDKPSDTNSSDVEKELAKPVVNEIFKFLRNEGFEEPVVCDSANGFHLLYRQAMKSTTEHTETMKKFLQVLDMYFSTDKVKIDCTTYNASRVSKLYGVISRKGANTAERPQRESKILRVPKIVKPTANEYFEKVAGYLPQPEKRDRSNNYGFNQFDLEDFLQKHNIAVRNKVETTQYTKYVLEHCPFNSAHAAPDSAVFKMRDGSFGFKCLHNSDADKTFRDFRLFYEPEAYDREYTPHRSFSPYNSHERKQHISPQEKEENKGNVWQTLAEIEDEDRSQIVSIPSGIIQYDKECCGFDKPSLTVWSGNNGSAKSTLLNQIALNAVNRGFKVAIYTGELRGKRMKRWIVQQAAGKRYNKKSTFNDYDYFTPKDISERVVAWLGENMYNYNTKYSHDIEQVCEEVKKLVEEHHVDMLVMDNLSCLDIDALDGSINEQQKNAIKMILRLTNELEIATHLVIHPKKSETFLRKNDVSGAKTLTDLADCVLFVHRWNQDTQNAAKEFLLPPVFNDLCVSGATNVVEVVKQREFGEAEGHIYKLYFEPESRRLKNYVAETIHYGWEDEPTQTTIEVPATGYKDYYNTEDDNDNDYSNEYEDDPLGHPMDDDY